ncbi:MAG: hypothetical protein ACOH2J_03170 [Allorhizobium sp.]
MRIDTGQSNYQYQSRFRHIETDSEEAAADVVTTPKWGGRSSVAVSSTLLSSSLANALWGIEGGSDAVKSPTAKDASSASSAVAQVEAMYLENSSPYDDGNDK